MYEFIGKLIGLSLRSRNLLGFHFPSIVWKPLVGQTVDLEDVQAVDVLALNGIKALEGAESKAVELFNSEMAEIKFTVMGADSVMHPLCPGGESKSLTFENRHEFVALMKQYRLTEFRKQTAAIRRGLHMVVPLDSLCLFTWREVQSMVCGHGFRSEDVDLLAKNTQYKSYSASDQHIKWLWDILKNDFTDEQRQDFLIFVWGRSRLPLTSAEFDTPFKIASRSGGNGAYPLAHTCFFQIDLPVYTDRATMVNKLLTAITMCGVIDAD